MYDSSFFSSYKCWDTIIDKPIDRNRLNHVLINLKSQRFFVTRGGSFLCWIKSTFFWYICYKMMLKMLSSIALKLHWISSTMDPGSPAFSLTIALLVLVLSLTGIGVFFSFGPGSKQLIDPWDHDDDWDYSSIYTLFHIYK